jgi:3-oxoacyl-[acyl-carrier-protein] synthase-1
MPQWADLHFSSQVSGQPPPFVSDLKALGLRTRDLTPMSEAARMGLFAALQALEEAGIDRGELRNSRSACVTGCGVSEPKALHDAYGKIAAGEVRRAAPYTVLKCMSSTVSAAITSVAPVAGLSLGLGAACATSAHALGIGLLLIRTGQADVVVCGGADVADIGFAGAFDAMRGALSTGFNDRPAEASRPFDRRRDGFVVAGGAGMVVLEERERALSRGAEIVAEVMGYGASSDGHHLIQPDPEGAGAARSMKAALHDAEVSTVDYINAHGTSTRHGDAAELRAIRTVFGESVPPISSTKSMGGHAVAAAGALEVIHCTVMMHRRFLAPNVNLTALDDEFRGMPVIETTREASPSLVMSNSFGFGGTNASLVLGL